jgi:hypothetical protein
MARKILKRHKKPKSPRLAKMTVGGEGRSAGGPVPDDGQEKYVEGVQVFLHVCRMPSEKAGGGGWKS